jgi:hypothetical protein
MRPGLGRTRRWLRTSRAAFRRVLLAVLCIAGLGSGLVRVSGAQEPNPFVGTWRANLSRSEQPPNHIREGTTLEVVVDGDMLNLLTRAPGQDAMGQTLRVDGEYAPGDSGITFTTVRPGPRRLEVALRDGGVLRGSWTYQVSPDGERLVVQATRRYPNRPVEESVVVYDRP